MKKFVTAFALGASLCLAACDEPETVTPAPEGEVVIVDECPAGKSTTGEPCK